MEQPGSPYNKIEEEFIASLYVSEHLYEGQVETGLRMLQHMQRIISAPLLRMTDDAQGTKYAHDTNMAHLRTYMLALFIEVGELMNEFAWKPWKPNHAVDLHKIVKEFSDILAFIGVILILMQRLHPSITVELLAHTYIETSKDNANRMKGLVEGYEK